MRDFQQDSAKIYVKLNTVCLISDKSFGWAGGLPAPPTADISPNITAINFPVNQHIAALLHGMSLSTLVYSYKHVAVFPKSNESRDSKT